MKLTKKISIHAAIALALVFTAPLAAAVDVGLGVSLNNNWGVSCGYGVSIPLRVGNFTVEQDLSFSD